MKVLVPRFLIILCLFSFTPLREMIKVPVLFFHYLEHLREDPNITFSGFLDMHYMHGIVYDEDYARDMQLPFKVIDSSAISAFVVEEISIYENDFKAAGKHGSKSLYAFNSYVQDPRVIGIFHPPRLA